MSRFTSRIIMVEATSFEFNEETGEDNAFMKRNESQGWLDEFLSYKATLQRYGIEVLHLINKDPAAKDCIFTNNWYIAFGLKDLNVKTLVICPMRHPSRRLERQKEFIEILAKEYENIIDLSYFEDQGMFLEGTGSLVVDRKNKILFMSRSERSSEVVLEKLIEKMNEISEHKWRTVVFSGKDRQGKEVYHSNIIMSLTPNKAILNIASVAEEDRERVINELVGYEVINLTYDAMERFAGNVEVLFSPVTGGEVAFVSETARGLLELDCPIEYISIPTIEKVGGGSTQCMIGKLN